MSPVCPASWADSLLLSQGSRLMATSLKMLWPLKVPASLISKVLPCLFFLSHILQTSPIHPWNFTLSSVQLLSCVQLCNPIDCSMPDFPVHHQLLELTQTHVHRVDDAIQPSHPLSSPSPSAFILSQHRGLFQWVSSWHQVAKVLEFQLQISPSNEYSGLISFRMDWLHLLAVQGTLKHLLQLLSHKKGQSNATGSNVDEPRDYHTKWNKSERQIPYDITYMWNLKYDTNELYKTETDSQT